MKIAIFEKIHDAAIRQLSEYGDVIDLSRLSEEDRLKNLELYDVIFVKSVTQVNKDFIDKATNLKFVGRPGTGVDNIDREYIAQKGIVFTNSPTANSVSTAEYTICLIFMLLRNIPDAIRFVDQNDYRRHRLEGRELSTMSVGIVGLGNVGLNVAKRLQNFGCCIYGYDHTDKNKDLFEELGGIFCNELKELLQKSDIVTLHLTLNKDTDGFVNREFFKSMRSGSYFINTSRGRIVKDSDLLEMLRNNHIAKAALDVVDPEPPYDLSPENHNYNNKLINHPSVFFSPHIGASTFEAQERMVLDVLDKFKDFFHSRYKGNIAIDT